jgi:hypothetical protein
LKDQTTSYLSPMGLNTSGVVPPPPTSSNNFITYHHPIRSTKFPNNITFLNGNSSRFKKSRIKKPLEYRKVLPKNALMMLHELRPSAEYRLVSKTGLTHKPIFTVGISIEEHSFEGVGMTKKEARVSVAEKCVEFLLKHPEYVQKCVNQNKDGGSKNHGSPSSAAAELSSDLLVKSEMMENDDSQDCEENEVN